MHYERILLAREYTSVSDRRRRETNVQSGCLARPEPFSWLPAKDFVALISVVLAQSRQFG